MCVGVFFGGGGFDDRNLSRVEIHSSTKTCFLYIYFFIFFPGVSLGYGCLDINNCIVQN